MIASFQLLIFCAQDRQAAITLEYTAHRTLDKHHVLSRLPHLLKPSIMAKAMLAYCAYLY